MRVYILLLMFFWSISGQAQLADGSTAPDFTLTDINGNTIHLYDYLDAGKTVYIDIFAAHCPTCWAYHNTHHLRDLYEQHGPGGSVSDEIMVIAVEHDPSNGTPELTGTGGATAGDWVTGTPYPIINPEGADRAFFNTAYDAVYYPMVYAICPDKKITLVGTQTSADLYNHVGTCAAMNVAETSCEKPGVYFRNDDNSIHLTNIRQRVKTTLQVFDMAGRPVLSLPVQSNTISFSDFAEGVYVYTLTDENGISVTGKFYR